MFKGFRELISRGNVIDLAAGIIIGAAFLAIVPSLVSDVIMPPVGMLLNGVDFSDLFIALDGRSYESLAAAQAAGAATVNYGLFLNAVISFLIVAYAVFLLVRAVNRLRRQQDENPADAPPPPRNEVLLEEIRDLLKSQRG